LTQIAKKRLDVVKRLFKMFDKVFNLRINTFNASIDLQRY